MIKTILAVLLTINLFANDLFDKKEQEWIEKNPDVTISMMDNFTAFSYIHNNTHKGYTVDLLNKISNISGLNFNVETLRWYKSLEKFKNKDVDLIAGISYTKQREDFTLFCDPYYEIPTYIFGFKNNKDYIDNSSLVGKTVGVSKSVFFIEEFKNSVLI
ncbi:MAG: transporter substrate-binding domain-containing protein [Campylobacterota bacterium]|nr:transporter substrate-binding domain-containing protein [Campylobacterota bacterium]